MVVGLGARFVKGPLELEVLLSSGGGAGLGTCNLGNADGVKSPVGAVPVG